MWNGVLRVVPFKIYFLICFSFDHKKIPMVNANIDGFYAGSPRIKIWYFLSDKFIIIRLLCRCAAVPVHEAYIAHRAHPVLCTNFGFKKGIRAVSCPYPTPICVK